MDNFLLPNFGTQFIYASFACIKGKGLHNSSLYVQNMMRKAKINWGSYYILKTDVSKCFQSIDKGILIKILERKINDTADYSYRRLQKGDVIFCKTILTGKGISIDYIERLEQEEKWNSL